jgi:hypothetical protein
VTYLAAWERAIRAAGASEGRDGVAAIDAAAAALGMLATATQRHPRYAGVAGFVGELIRVDAELRSALKRGDAQSADAVAARFPLAAPTPDDLCRIVAKTALETEGGSHGPGYARRRSRAMAALLGFAEHEAARISIVILVATMADVQALHELAYAVLLETGVAVNVAVGPFAPTAPGRISKATLDRAVHAWHNQKPGRKDDGGKWTLIAAVAREAGLPRVSAETYKVAWHKARAAVRVR